MALDLKSEVVERFLRYAKIDTQSDETSGTHPSSEKQLDLARVLISELDDMGAQYSFDEENGYIYCTIKENLPELAIGDDLADVPKIGFIAHMDTSPEASGAGVKPQIIEDYDGGDIVLGGGAGSDSQVKSDSNAYCDDAQQSKESEQHILSPSDFPELLKYKGQTLITSDGTTLLGSDDKSGIAEIMTMVHYFLTHPEIRHGQIYIAFTPDEEIGEGTLNFDLGKFGADFAYTVDGGELGELSYENFNAATAVIKVTGRNVHPGEAYGKMIHAARLAMEIDSKLPSKERPELTRDHEGFYHLTDMRGDASEASLVYILRDHDSVLFEKKKETIAAVCEEVEAAHPGAKVECEIKDTYFNMIDKIRPHMEIVKRCEEAMRRCGITPKIEPIRGGTDGAMLSYRGLLCPNICAGGHNFHGVYEYVSCEAMAKITELLIELAKA
ncbi:MAG: peptidase T [Clostridiales bacterium]|nr:peptidase T [Clostridiales bacterium]